MGDTVVRKHIIFYGRVQDVGFRYFSVYKARLLSNAGFIQAVLPVPAATAATRGADSQQQDSFKEGTTCCNQSKG